MNRLLLFFKKIYVLLIFILLEVAALNFYADSNSYTKAKMLMTSNAVSSYINEALSGVSGYFGLRSENDMLIKRIAELNNELEGYRVITDSLPVTIAADIPTVYFYSAASVINNSVTRQENYITIDRGTRDGVMRNMAMISPEGTIVGYLLESSDKYAVGISILNTNFRTGGRIKGRDYFGSVWWDGLDHTRVMLSEVPKYADIALGDTIVTGYSSIFPPDVVIGTVESFELDQSMYYNVRVKLATRMSALKKVLLINYADIQERELLEKDYFNE